MRQLKQLFKYIKCAVSLSTVFLAEEYINAEETKGLESLMICNFYKKNYLDDQVQEDEMGRTCSPHGRD